MIKITIPDEHGDRYQLENWISKLNRRNDLKTAPINVPWLLQWKYCLTKSRTDLYGSRSETLGGLRPSLDTECAPIDSTVGICRYVAQNDRLVP
jgi:hypothetical protein